MLSEYLPQLMLAWSILLVGVLSPGPSVMLILGVAMDQGRARSRSEPGLRRLRGGPRRSDHPHDHPRRTERFRAAPKTMALAPTALETIDAPNVTDGADVPYAPMALLFFSTADLNLFERRTI